MKSLLVIPLLFCAFWPIQSAIFQITPPRFNKTDIQEKLATLFLTDVADTLGPYVIEGYLSGCDRKHTIDCGAKLFRENTDMVEYFRKRFGFILKDLHLNCTTCTNLFKDFPPASKDLLRSEFMAELEKYCKTSHDANECDEGMQMYSAVIFDSLCGHYLNPTYACEIVMPLCPKTIFPLNLTEYIQNVTNGEPDTPLPNPDFKSTFKVLHVSDIHLDPLYIENGIVNCNDSICCRQPATANETDVSGYWGTPASCDLPARTAEQMAIFISQNVPVDLVVWTGDNSQHDIEKTSPQNINNTLFITSLFKQYLPNIPVYPAMGNHETFPLETWVFNFNTSVYTDSEEKTYEQDLNLFESTFSSEWADWLGAEAASTFAENGYYSSLNQQFNVRIISLNTNACENRNFYLLLDPSDPGGMLSWLEDTLATSEANSENVYIIGHIPPGSADCFTQWSDRFSAIIERYAYIIRGQFFGHAHSDSFFLYKSYNEPGKTIQMGFMTPSMTPNYKRDPTFRVYEIDMDTKLVVNYQQYKLDLQKANENPTEPLYWNVSYSFLEAYDFPNVSLATYDAFRDDLLNDNNIYEIYQQNYAPGDPSQCPSNKEAYCNVLSAYDQILDCYKSLNVTVVPDKETEMLNVLSGPWMNKTVTI